jgi:uncharacterized protein YcgI (DUF1989 family)
MPIIESKLELRHAVYDLTLPSGEPWLHEVKRGQVFRILDLEGNQAVDTLFYNSADPLERYSAQDTIRAQRNLYLSAGSVLMSNLGKPMLTIVADTCGRHDTLGGACAAESNTVRYALDKRYMQLPRQLPACDHALHLRRGHAARQARHCEQHQLLHERARHAARQTDVRGRYLRAGQVR